MHTPHLFSPMYTAPMHGAAMPSHQHHYGHGFCQSCCHPVAQCCCGTRSCRKEAKELLVTPDTKTDPAGVVKPGSAASTLHAFIRSQDTSFTVNNPDLTSEDVSKRAYAMALAEANAAALGTAFIGGGCCAHLSIEYMPVPAAGTAKCIVYVMLKDSDQIVLLWGKTFEAGSEYTVKECIMSTKPGATVQLIVLNAIARLRWCEVFSC